MKIMVATAVVAVAGQSLAGERENALSHIAQAMAVAQLCPHLEVDSTMASLVAVSHDVDIGRDKQELLVQIRNQMAPWKGKPTEAACVAGLMLYGPGGANVPGLIREK